MTCSRGVGSADLDTDYLPYSCQHRTAQDRDCVGTQVDLATLVDQVDLGAPSYLGQRYLDLVTACWNPFTVVW